MFPKQTFVARLGSYTFSGANSITFAPGMRARIKRIIFAITTTHTTTKAVLTLQSRPIAGTAANETALGTIEIPASGAAAGDIFYHEPGRPYENTDSTPLDPAGRATVVTTAEPDLPVIPAAGDLIITSDGGGDAGVANVFVEYEQEPQGQDVSGSVVRLDRTD